MSGQGGAPAGAGGEGQGGQGTKTVEQRLDAQDEKIDSIGSKLDTLIGKLPGVSGSGDKPRPEGGQGDLAPGSPSIADQVAEGVAKIEAGKKAKAAADAETAWRKKVEDHLAEHKPAEPPAPSRFQRFQRGLYGG